MLQTVRSYPSIHRNSSPIAHFNRRADGRTAQPRKDRRLADGGEKQSSIQPTRLGETDRNVAWQSRPNKGVRPPLPKSNTCSSSSSRLWDDHPPRIELSMGTTESVPERRPRRYGGIVVKLVDPPSPDDLGGVGLGGANDAKDRKKRRKRRRNSSSVGSGATGTAAGSGGDSGGDGSK